MTLIIACSVEESSFPSIEVLKQGLATQEAKLLASDGAIYDRFGRAVAVFGNTAVIGSPNGDVNFVDAGTAYVFVKNGTTWGQTQKLTSNDANFGDGFGSSVSISKDTILVGASGDSTLTGASYVFTGAAYVFARSGETWMQHQKLTASDGAESDGAAFGDSLSLYEDTAIIGAYSDDELGSEAGAAYIFKRSGTVWTEQQKLTASDGDSSDMFGISVSVYANTALVGAWRDEVNGFISGSAYVFKRSGTVWTEQQKLTALDRSEDDYFGWSVDLSENTSIIGADGDDDQGSRSGAVYVFGYNGTTWNEQQKLTAADTTPSNDCFGNSVSIYESMYEKTLVAGAWCDEFEKLSAAGSAYVFGRSGTTWVQQKKLVASDAGAGDFFGSSVAIHQNLIVVGAYTDSDLGDDSGSAYIFNDPDTVLPPEITAPIFGATLSSGAVDFVWSSNNMPVETYWLYIGNSYASGNLFDSGSLSSSTLSKTVIGLPTDGRMLFVRLWYKESSTWKYRDYTYTASGTQPSPSMASPTTGTTLQGNNVTFSWSSNGATVCNWWLYLGSGKGLKNFHDSGSIPSGTTSIIVGGLPTNGTAVWVRLWYGCSGVWKYIDAQYTAAIPSITSPVTGATLTSSSETFTWTANGIAITEWWIYAGPSTGSRAYLDSGSLGLNTSTTINTLPIDGSLVFIRLWFKLSGVWKYNDYQYVSSGSGAPLLPSMTSFMSGSSVPDTNAVFNWNSGGLTVADWWLQIGTSRGAFNLHNSGSLGTKLSTTINSLPPSVNPIYVRLWFYAGGGWKYLDYQYSVCDYPNDATCQPEWNVVKPDSNFNSAFTSIWGTSDNNIFVVGLDGAIYHFNGSQWNRVITTATAQLQDIWGSSGSDIHIIGKDSTWIHYDGTSWTNSTFDFSGITKIGIHGSAANDVWVAHNSGVSHFDGTSWSLITTETAVGRDIVVFDSNDIWVANENYSTGKGEIWQGGGTAWAGSATGWWGEYSTSTSVLNGIWGTSRTNLYAVGNDGVVAHRGVSGAWQELNINAGSTTLGNVTGNAANNVFISGYGGFLSHFDGTTWTNESPGIEIGGMWISPSGKVYGAGNGGNVLIRTLEKIP